MRLTAKERILLHLFEYVKFADVVDVPPEIAQEGIARSVGIRVHHVRQFVGPLIQEGLVRERVAHVLGHRRRLKVYYLTESGRVETARLRVRVREDVIRVRSAQGVRELSIGDAIKEVAGRATMSDLVREAAEGKVVDLDAIPSVRAGAGEGFVERLGEAPRLEKFVGRRRELEAITRDGDGPRFFLIRGVAGIGKSSLAAKACEKLSGSRNLFWHRVRPWDTRLSILAALADFLAAMGRPGLRAVLSRGETAKADDALRQGLVGTKSVLVFDDAHEGIREVFDFLGFFKDVVAEAPDVKAIILSRQAIPAYDRRDVAIRRLVKEVDLEGLRAEEIVELLPPGGEAKSLMGAAQKLGGHPLLIELLSSATRRGTEAESLKDVHAFIEEEIYGELSETERRMIKTAALYAVPFPREAVLSDPMMSHDTFRALTARSLVRPIGSDTFGVHDTIREFFVSVLTPSERESLGRFAVNQLLRLADRAKVSKDFVTVLNCLSNALELADSREQQAALCEGLGDTYERLGDLPATLASYSEAARWVDGPESLARLHRKTAAALQVRGEPARAIAEIEVGFRALGEKASVERGWLELAESQAASWREDWGEARTHGNRALEVFRAFQHSEGSALAHLELGKVEINAPKGRPDRARRHLDDAMALAPAIEDESFTARAHLEMARFLAYRAIDIDRAMTHLAAAESLVERTRDPHTVRALLMLKGWLGLEFRGDYDLARRSFEEVVTLGREIHSPVAIAFARFGLANVEFFEGHVEESRQEFEALSSEMVRLGYPNFAIESLWMVAQCSLWLEDRPGILKALSQMRSPDTDRGLAFRPLHVAVARGVEQFLKGDREGSIESFREAVRASDESYRTDETSPVYFTEFYLGVGLLAIGRDAEGIGHLKRAEQLLQKHGLKARLSVPPEAARRFAEFLRRASPST